MSLDDADIERIAALLKPEEEKQADSRNDAKITAEVARRVAQEVSVNLSAQISQVHEGLAVNSAKLDDLQGTMNARHEEQRIICDKQNSWVASIQEKVLKHEAHVLEMDKRGIIAKVIDHEALKNRSIGALKISSVAAPFGAALILAKVKHFFGW